MRFGYYGSLSRKDKATYDASDRVGFVAMPGAEGLRPIVGVLRQALEQDESVRAADRVVIQAAAGRLVLGITTLLEVEPVDVRVLAVRPALRAAELHGLYTREPGRRPEIRVWMRTLAHKRVVAFRTFLRTLLHEVCHHLDYTLLALPESFHTQGFFNRESSLFKQLVPELVRPPRVPRATRPDRE
jgi:hypothetical protein